MTAVVECVINLSEGRDADVVGNIASAAGVHLIDVHLDADHNRSVLTVAGSDAAAVQAAARSVASAAVAALDLRTHRGVHPRLGVVDVVPFVALESWPLRAADPAPAVAERDAFARWAAHELGVPCFLYGPERSLPEVRRRAWKNLFPDAVAPGADPGRPHPSAGAVAVGARPPLVAYNLWLRQPDLALARRIASALRRPDLRTLGLQVGGSVQVSCNLVDPTHLGPGAVYDAVAELADIDRAELVGLVPQTVLEAEPARRRAELGLDGAVTVEARLVQAGLV